jgi:hypothetical protein
VPTIGRAADRVRRALLTAAGSDVGSKGRALDAMSLRQRLFQCHDHRFIYSVQANSPRPVLLAAGPLRSRPGTAAILREPSTPTPGGKIGRSSAAGKAHAHHRPKKPANRKVRHGKIPGMPCGLRAEGAGAILGLGRRACGFLRGHMVADVARPTRCRKFASLSTSIGEAVGLWPKFAGRIVECDCVHGGVG